jgi:hypothetical protein
MPAPIVPAPTMPSRRMCFCAPALVSSAGVCSVSEGNVVLTRER